MMFVPDAKKSGVPAKARRSSRKLRSSVGIGFRACLVGLADFQRVDQVVFLSLFALEARLIVSATAAAVDRHVWIHADLPGASRTGLRRHDIVRFNAVFDPV